MVYRYNIREKWWGAVRYSPKVVGRSAADNLNVPERGEAAGHLGKVDHVVAPLDELVREVEYQLVFHRPRQRVLLILSGELYMKGN